MSRDPRSVTTAVRTPPTAPAPAIRIDRVRCTGHGACAQVAPRAITLDEWGYPIVSAAPVDPETAEEAVMLCPARAIYLQ